MATLKIGFWKKDLSAIEDEFVHQEGVEVFKRENLTVLDGVDFHPELLSHLSWGETGKRKLWFVRIHDKSSI